MLCECLLQLVTLIFWNMILATRLAKSKSVKVGYCVIVNRYCHLYILPPDSFSTIHRFSWHGFGLGTGIFTSVLGKPHVFCLSFYFQGSQHLLKLSFLFVILVWAHPENNTGCFLFCTEILHWRQTLLISMCAANGSSVSASVLFVPFFTLLCQHFFLFTLYIMLLHPQP